MDKYFKDLLEKKRRRIASYDKDLSDVSKMKEKVDNLILDRTSEEQREQDELEAKKKLLQMIKKGKASKDLLED